MVSPFGLERAKTQFAEDLRGAMFAGGGGDSDEAAEMLHEAIAGENGAQRFEGAPALGRDGPTADIAKVQALVAGGGDLRFHRLAQLCAPRGALRERRLRNRQTFEGARVAGSGERADRRTIRPCSSRVRTCQLSSSTGRAWRPSGVSCCGRTAPS